jgi:vacuolar-type H+-ATPase subunit I/STV1
MAGINRPKTKSKTNTKTKETTKKSSNKSNSGKKTGTKPTHTEILSYVESGIDVVNQIFTTFNNITSAKTERLKIQAETKQVIIQSNNAKAIKIKELDQMIKTSEEETKRFIEEKKVEMLKTISETQLELEKLDNEQNEITLKYNIEMKRLEIFETLANKMLDQYNIYLNAYNTSFDTGTVIIAQHELQDLKELRSQLTNLALSQAPSNPLLLQGETE